MTDIPDPTPGDGAMLHAVPQDRLGTRTLVPDPDMSTATRPRRRSPRKPPPLPWQPARWIELRTAGTGTERVPADAVAIERDWVTVRHGENGQPRVTAYPLWRVTEIEMRNT